MFFSNSHNIVIKHLNIELQLYIFVYLCGEIYSCTFALVMILSLSRVNDGIRFLIALSMA